MSFSDQVRDPVHGFILWGKDVARGIVDIVDTPTFQRLRRIRQLAFAHYVYPGATHTRFEHSLGVFHIAGRLADKMKLSRSNRNLVLQAALLHDIGHGPFSHVSENVLEKFYDERKVQLEEKEKIHEMVTWDIIRHDENLARCISSSQKRNDIIKLLSEGYGDQILKDIVSGPLDADKMDYLLRDSLYCGVRYGIYDLDQLISSLVPGDDPSGGKTLMIEPDGLHVVEQFVLAKYYITTQVYFHKVRRVTDAMLTRAVCEGIETDNIDELRQLYTYDGSPEFAHRYLEWDDERLLREYTSERYNGKVIYDIFNRLRYRRLYKLIYSKSVNEFRGEVYYQQLSIMKPDDPRLKKLESVIADSLDKKNYEVIVSLQDVKNVKEAAGSEGPVMVRLKAPEEARPFEQESSLFRSINEKLLERCLDCYLAIEDKNDRRKQEKRVEKVIKEELPVVLGKGGMNDAEHE
ncbi:hypothetical protein CH330_08875 [candidate division WOR-3 bacterium JGI_Cruoil_03_51_56]|uniref:HD domain-containing protein n=1 Tax=candidate division WOR-3 bacterium JGI_Cruoil_03_51_56 TaxID=1973747 RepID=A0A235BQP5_UNCW3|nr:MAG: hypothetical protein CH330_08875 [candidate division WOR-3 bacterium JGI_Cruoil_03_51_56]